RGISALHRGACVGGGKRDPPEPSARNGGNSTLRGKLGLGDWLTTDSRAAMHVSGRYTPGRLALLQAAETLFQLSQLGIRGIHRARTLKLQARRGAVSLRDGDLREQ